MYRFLAWVPAPEQFFENAYACLRVDGRPVNLKAKPQGKVYNSRLPRMSRRYPTNSFWTWGRNVSGFASPIFIWTVMSYLSTQSHDTNESINSSPSASRSVSWPSTHIHICISMHVRIMIILALFNRAVSIYPLMAGGANLGHLVGDNSTWWGYAWEY